MKRTFTWGIFIAVNLGSALYAARPLIVDDAGTVEKGKFQLPFGVQYKSDSECSHWDVPVSLGYGLLANLEVGAGFGWQLNREELSKDCDEHHGWDDLSPYAKWRFLEQEKYFFDQTLSAAIKIPVASHEDGLGSGKVDYSLTWIATRQWTESLATDVNVGYMWVGRTNDPDDTGSDILFYGTAVRYQLTKTLQPVAEIFAQEPVNSSDQTQFIINGGLRVQISEQVVLDGAIGTGIGGDAPDLLATLGLTWTF